MLSRTQEKYQIRISYRCGVKVFAKACVLAVVALLLLLSGDVELNPGPPKLGMSEYFIIFFFIFRHILASFLASHAFKACRGAC